MKSEPNVYGIDDLEREGVNTWDGCRSYQVRNTIRDAMKVGDLAFFYHSRVDPTGVVGVMEVVSDAFPDPTQFDPNSSYWDPKSPVDAPRWLARNVRFVKRLSRTVTLAELKSTPGLEGMAVCRKGQRLSVLPVTEREWGIVVRLAEAPARRGHRPGLQGQSDSPDR
jgi:predicted RNA-binding protein with PUA-like domain